MTEESRRENLREEWLLSETTWNAAEALMSLGFFRDAVSRYYYAALHAARAALLSRGVETTTHSGLVTEFSRHFVKTGLLETRLSRILGRLESDREEADYARSVPFTHEDAREAQASAELLRTAVARVLNDEGWLA